MYKVYAKLRPQLKKHHSHQQDQLASLVNQGTSSFSQDSWFKPSQLWDDLPILYGPTIKNTIRCHFHRVWGGFGYLAIPSLKQQFYSWTSRPLIFPKVLCKWIVSLVISFVFGKENYGAFSDCLTGAEFYKTIIRDFSLPLEKVPFSLLTKLLIMFSAVEMGCIFARLAPPQSPIDGR